MTTRAVALAAVVASVAAALPAPASAAYRYTGGWGREGKARGQFGTGRERVGGDRQYDDPGGIAIARGTVYVADPSNNRVQRFTTRGRFLGSFGSFGFDPGGSRLHARGRFILPEGLASDRHGQIYVADSRNDRLTKWSARGRWIKRLARGGAFPGRLVNPWGVAVSRAGVVYVADQTNYRVNMYTTSGRYRGYFGRFGSGPGRFQWLFGVAVSPRGTVYVTDQVRNRVMRFTARGRFLGEWGSKGTRAGQFVKAQGVAIGPNGRVLVADRCNHRIQRFTSSGRFVESFGRSVLRAPSFLAVNGAGTVFVSDYHRVARFAPTSARRATTPATTADHNHVDVLCRHLGGLGSAY